MLSGRSSHRPVTHRAHPAAVGVATLRYSQASPVRRTAGAAGFVGVDFHYEPPAGEAGACKPVQGATQWLSARSGTDSTVAQRLSGLLRGFQLPGVVRRSCLSAAALLPSHIPSDGLLVGRTPDRARGPLLIFRKILNYGKTKKSTHGHQTTKPFCTHFSHASSEYSFSHADSNGTTLVAARRLWRAVRGRSRVG